MNNIEVKEALKKSNVKQWELANALDINEFSLSRKLRNNISDSELSLYIDKIKNIAKERSK